MAWLEDRLKALENRKRPRLYDTEDNTEDQPEDQPEGQPEEQPEDQSGHRPSRSTGRHVSVYPSIELSDSESSSSDTIRHYHKQHRYTKGIKINPSYTLRISSSLRA